MTLKEIKRAVDNGHVVHWANDGYKVVKSGNEYLIQHVNGHCIGLTWQDGVTMNGNPNQFYVALPF